jgi:putative DNA primase/helicase
MKANAEHFSKEKILERLPIARYYEEELKNVRWNGDGQGTALCCFHEDHTPSLSINKTTGDFQCFGCGAKGDIFRFHQDHHGCDFRQALRALADLAALHDDQDERIVATYDYVDQNGRLLYQVVRREPKDFRQRRPDGNGGWIWNLKGIIRVPYNLPALIKADVVAVPEGEKDVETLRRLGIVGTCNAGGAGKWKQEYNSYFAGKTVVILPDNDEPGHKHAQQVAESLKIVAKTVKVVELPGLPPKGDITDWLTMGHKAGDLMLAIEQAAEWTPEQREKQGPEKVGLLDDRTDDLGNAQRFLDLHGPDILWSGEWYVWTGKVWQRDQTLEVNKKAESMQKVILDQLAGVTNDRQRKELLSLALKLGSHTKIKAMLELSKSGVAVTQDTFDTDRYLLNCENGTINLKTGELLPHRREDYITRMVPVAYDPQATCPKWIGFLTTIFGGSNTLIAFVQKAVGYSLTADTGEQCFFILYGTGQNGKSTFLNVVTKMLAAYAVTCRMDTFIAKKGSQIPNDVARLKSSHFVSAIETERGRKLAEGLIKSMSGGDQLTARFLHHEYFDFEPTFKIWLGVNHKPVIKDTTFAMSRRIRLIPFTVAIPEEDRVLNFHDILINEELPGILTWAVGGCHLWQEDGLGWPKDVRDATDQYLADMDVLGDFLREKCHIEAGEKVAFKELYQAYVDWAGENKEEPLGRRTFGEVLEEKGYPAAIGHGNVKERRGLCLA